MTVEMADSDFDDSDVEEIDLFPNVAVETYNDITNKITETEVEREGTLVSVTSNPYSESSTRNIDSAEEVEYQVTRIKSIFESTTGEQISTEQQSYEDKAHISSDESYQTQNCEKLIIEDDIKTSTIKSFKHGEENDTLQDQDKLSSGTQGEKENDKVFIDESIVSSENLPVLQDEYKVKNENEAVFDDESKVETEKEVYNENTDISFEEVKVGIKKERVNNEDLDFSFAKVDVQNGQSNGTCDTSAIAGIGCKEGIRSVDRSMDNNEQASDLLLDCKLSCKRTLDEFHSEEGLTKRQKSLDNPPESLTETCENTCKDPVVQAESLIKDIKKKEQNKQNNVVSRDENQKGIVQEQNMKLDVLKNCLEIEEPMTNSECPPIAIVSPLGEEKIPSPIDSRNVLNTVDQFHESKETQDKTKFDTQTSLDELSVEDIINSIFEAGKSDTFQTLDGSSWIFPDLEDVTGQQNKEYFTNFLDLEKNRESMTPNLQIAPADIQAIIKQEIPTDIEDNVSLHGTTEKGLGENEAINESQERYLPYSVSTEHISPPPSEPVTKASPYDGLLKQGPPNRIAPIVDNIPYTKANDYSILINILQSVTQAQNQNQSIVSTNGYVASTVSTNLYSTAKTIPSTQLISILNTDTTQTAPLSTARPHNQSIMYPRQPFLNHVRPEFASNRNQVFGVNNIQQHSRSSSVGSADSGYTSPVRSTTPVSLPQYPNHLPHQQQQQTNSENNWNQQSRQIPGDGHFVMPIQRRRNSLPQTSNTQDSSFIRVGYNPTYNQTQPNSVQSQIAKQKFNANSASFTDPVKNSHSRWNHGFSGEHTMQSSQLPELQQLSQHDSHINHSHHPNQQQHVPQLVNNTCTASATGLKGNTMFGSSLSAAYQSVQRGSTFATNWNSPNEQLQPGQSLNQSVLTMRQKLSAAMALASTNATPTVKLLVSQFINKLKIAKQSHLNEIQKQQLVNCASKFVNDITFLCKPSVGDKTSKMHINIGNCIGANNSGSLSGCGNNGFVSNSVSAIPSQSLYIQHTSADRHPTISFPSTYKNNDTYQSVLTNTTTSFGATNKTQYFNYLPSSKSGQSYQGNQIGYQSGNKNNMLVSDRSTANQPFLKNANNLGNIHGDGQFISNNVVTQNAFNQNKPPNVQVYDRFVNSVRPSVNRQAVYQGTFVQQNNQAGVADSNTTVTEMNSFSGFLPQVTNQLGQPQATSNCQVDDCFITGRSGLNNAHNNSFTADNAPVLDASSRFDDINPLERYIT